MSIALGLLLILALTAATGYFVAMEFAYVAVDRNALGQLAAGGDEPARRALKVTSSLSFTLSAAQFGITVTALLVGYISEPLVGVGLAELLDPSLSYAARLSLSVTLVLVFSTVVQMVFGELAPKNLAIARTVPLALSVLEDRAGFDREGAAFTRTLWTERRPPCCARSASNPSRSSNRARPLTT